MAWLSLVLWLTRTFVAQDQWRLVYQDGEVLQAAGEPHLDTARRSPLQFAWVWSDSRFPRRLAASEVGSKRSLPDTDPLRLQVRVVLPGRSGRKTEQDPASRPAPPASGSPGADRGLWVIAAPIEMWREVPEDLLPAWPVPANGRLAVPLDPARRWRVRLRGREEGSWWADVPAGRTSVLLAPARAGEIEILASGAEKRQPAEIRAELLEGESHSGGSRLWALLHASRGRLALRGLPDREEVTLVVSGAGFAPVVVRALPSALPRQLRLDAGASVAGRVITGKGGRPLGGAEVQIESWLSPTLPDLYTLGISSGADGSWRLAGLPPGRAALRISAPGYVPVRELVELAAGANDLGVRPLVSGRAVIVAVRDEVGTPVTGAKVDAGTGTAFISDARGLAHLSSLPAAPLGLSATAPGHVAGKARYNPPFSEPLSIVLPRATTLRGRLMQAPGLPVSEGTLRLEQASCQSEGRLGEDGRFERDIQPGQAMVLVLRSPVTSELRLHIAAGLPGELRDLGDLQAPEGLAVAGRVVDGRDGMPVAGARVWLPRPGPGGPAVAWATRDLLQSTSDADGRFRISGLASGAVVLRVEATGLARAHREVSLPGTAGNDPADGPGGPTALNDARNDTPPALEIGDIVLSGGATLRVLVRADRLARFGGPEGAVARADLRGDWLEPDMLSAPVADGTATLQGVPAGRVTVSVLSGHQLVCEQQVTVAEGEVRDVECGRSSLRVAGRVEVGGRPGGSGTLIWQQPAAVASRIDTVTTPDGLRQQQVFGLGRPQVDVAVAGDGSFLSADLTPGLWQVAWVPEQGSAATAALAVQVPESDHYETVLSYPGAVLGGVVTYQDGRPAEHAQVRDLVSGGMAFTGADGSFALAGVKPGKAIVQAKLLELSSQTAETVVQSDGPPPEPLHLVLDKSSPATIEVTVLSAAGTPLPGVFVFLEEAGKGLRILTTDSAGKATAGLEPPIATSVRAAAVIGGGGGNGAGGWMLGAWVPWEQAQNGLTLAPGATGTLLLATRTRQGLPRIVSAAGWDLSSLLSQLGMAPAVTPEQPLRLDGVPTGTYVVSLDGASATVVLTPDAPAEAHLE